MTERTTGQIIEELTQRAVSAFEAIMARASEAELWRLHAALEKATFPIVRGTWGRGVAEGREDLRGAAACPLTALVVGRPETEGDLAKAQRLVEERLALDGYRASDFYGIWDRGLLSHRRLLQIVDAETTRRALEPRRPAPA